MKISEKKIVKTTSIYAPLSEAWWQWTTHEGLLTFFGEDNKIEMTPGGPYEIYFSMEVPEGSRGAEGCEVLSFVPERMLSFTWNAPPKFKETRESDYHTWVVVEFQPLSEYRTQVTLTHLGWPEGAQWDEVYHYFDEAWGKVMEWLKDSHKSIQVQ